MNTNTPEKYQCPCCGYLTLSERGGYEICDACWWEDEDPNDVYGQPAPERLSGANYMQLSEAREHFLTLDDRERKRLDKFYTRPPYPEEIP